MDIKIIDPGMLEKIRNLGLPQVRESNAWLVVHVKGDGNRAPVNWNAKIYRNSSGDLKLVTTDMLVLEELLSGAPPVRDEEYKRIISIDDSGWGSPLLGVLIGAHDSLSGRIVTGEITVRFFQSPNFKSKKYLNEASRITASLLDLLKANPDGTLIKICTGCIHVKTVQKLREMGYRVKTEAIGEPLQSNLEKIHADYVKKMTGADIYYDPKEVDRKDLGKKFYETIGWIKKNNAWHLAKTGWKFFKNKGYC